MARVVAIDPGPTTGLAAYDQETLALVQLQLPAIEAMRWLNGEMDARSVTLVACERFTISSRTVRTDRFGPTTAIETVGVVKWLCSTHSVELVLQDPGEAMTFVDDARLKHLGAYVVDDHARDATRHLVLACVKRGVIPAERLLLRGGETDGAR